MKRNYIYLFVLALSFFVSRASAQMPHCYSSEVRQRLIAAHPEIVQAEADYEQQISNALKKIDFNKVSKTTFTDQSGNDSFWYDIPLVVHVIHDYNETQEYMSDNTIFNDVADWNVVYARQNADTTDVIAPFKKWIGNPHIRLRLANIDPSGHYTKGITRRRHYLTYSGGEDTKFDDWDPTAYVNVWFINQMSVANGMAAAYAHLPPDVTYIPFYDGVIALWDYADNDKTINHEIGHVLNLYHPWGSTNNPALACGDDNVDDTPPTMGHAEPGCRYNLPSSNQNSIYDTACAVNYYKVYADINGNDSLVNYPDTTNTQNIMDYTYCSRMFTIGQVKRMHAALNSTVGGRANLWSTTNLRNAGIIDSASNFIPRRDLKPIPEFSATKPSSSYMDRMNYFTFPGVGVIFHNETWNDTLSSLTWTFSNGAITPVYSSTTTATFSNSFSEPGWVDLKMTALGNNQPSDTTVEWKNAIFVADTAGTPAAGYVEEWDPAGKSAKWPYFNYYNNGFHWQLDSTVGFDDHYCMKYVGFDDRLDPALGIYPILGSPEGDFDDLFSIPADLSAFTDTCNLNFYYSAASRSSLAQDINDSLEIDYSVNKSATWRKLVILSKGSLINKGAFATAYTPAGMSDWAPQTIGIPAIARTPYTTFRFRYMPHVGQDGSYSSGNNFYMDRINFSSSPAEVSAVKLTNLDVAVVPNPTSGDAFVVIKDAGSAVAQVAVTDITGKVLFSINSQLHGGEANITIPHSAISVPGIYLVQTITGAQSQTRKLVVY